MKQYKQEVDKLETDRQELANAEKLFDLPITMYPELLYVQKEMKGLDQIYTIYEEQKVCDVKLSKLIIKLNNKCNLLQLKNHTQHTH